MQTDLTDALSRAFSDTLTRLRQRLREPLSALPVPLGPPDVGLLVYLATHPGCCPQDLARFLGRDKAQLTRKIKTLEGHALIRRQTDAQDGRRVCLFLTPAGERLAAQGKAIRHQAFAELLQGLTAAEQQQLLTLLEKCNLGGSDDTK
ncbi:MAG: MarR family transcriptional regulator [Pseudomonadales bacterium]|nr:MarR family transcriptional regulator [Pseudomonadales bacterium]